MPLSRMRLDWDKFIREGEGYQTLKINLGQVQIKNANGNVAFFRAETCSFQI